MNDNDYIKLYINEIILYIIQFALYCFLTATNLVQTGFSDTRLEIYDEPVSRQSSLNYV